MHAHHVVGHEQRVAILRLALCADLALVRGDDRLQPAKFQVKMNTDSNASKTVSLALVVVVVSAEAVTMAAVALATNSVAGQSGDSLQQSLRGNTTRRLLFFRHHT